MEFLEQFTDPFTIFSDWYAKAQSSGLPEPGAMTLSTADKSGRPSSRVVLLKGHDDGVFKFYTNMNSRKGRELVENPYASLLFLWLPLQKQVRIEGQAHKLEESEADAYFSSRHPQSRLGAWASKQSEALPSRTQLMEKFRDAEAQYSDNPPRPAYWSGFGITPDYFEFWEEGEFRLHNRRAYTKSGENWNSWLLNP